MKRTTLRLFLLLGTLSIAGIMLIQIYWVRKAFDLNEKQFNQTIHIVLKSVAQKLADFNNHTLPRENIVNQLSSDYFIVNVDDVIDANVLEHYLKAELTERSLILDFEYAIYDCTSNKMLYGNYVKLSGSTPGLKRSTVLPTWDEYNYYFGIRFPGKSSYIVSEMGIWVFFSFILLLVIGFFGYALFVILKQNRLSEIQKDFINNMTHEFKTPISTIAISADVLSSPAIIGQPQKLLNYAGIIREENLRLKKQVEKVLNMVHVEKSEFRMRKEEVNIHELIKDVIQNFNPVLEDTKGVIRLHLNALNPTVEADKLHLTNIIYNLLDNAFKYTKRAPDIEIYTRDDKKGICLCIKDNGIGIDKAFEKKVFEKFFRVPTKNIHDVKGFGLGLSYVKSIVDAHRWKIRMESAAGEGTTVSLYIHKHG